MYRCICKSFRYCLESFSKGDFCNGIASVIMSDRLLEIACQKVIEVSHLVDGCDVRSLCSPF
jgi:hypothetical protein